MNTYPAVRDPGSIELLFRSVRNSPRPDKITTDYLASIGFRRQSDVKLLELLFFLGFIDSNLSPSELWNAASDSDEIAFASILAGALSKSYSKVFEIYPDGRNIDGKALMTLFKEQTGVSDTEAAYMVLTLQVLADMADFGKGETLQQKSPPSRRLRKKKLNPPPPSRMFPTSPPPTIEIPREGLSLNITIPPEAMDKEMTEIVKSLLKAIRKFDK